MTQEPIPAAGISAGGARTQNLLAPQGDALDMSSRYWRLAVVAMLVLLHMAALRGAQDASARALLLAHIGLLLLWQPFLRRERTISGTHTVLIAAAAILMTWKLNAWLLALWVIGLAAVVGGKLFRQTEPWKRRFYFVMLVYLLGLLVTVVLPDIAQERAPAAVLDWAVLDWVGAYGLPTLLAAILFFPVEPEQPGAAPPFDFFYGAFMAFVLVVVTLGSLAFARTSQTDFLDALTVTVFGIAGLVLALGVAWAPRSGYAGLSALLSQYFFSAGQPFERWLRYLADLAQTEEQPERFLAKAADGLVGLPWVAGASWRTAGSEGFAGARSSHIEEFALPDVKLTIYSRYGSSPALRWQALLLSELLAEFYGGKLREKELQEASYVQAVHETGARLTHDIKNLLQSLEALCALVTVNTVRQPEELLALLRRQLPAISARLSSTLTRLGQPESQTAARVSAAKWWEMLRLRYDTENIAFSAIGSLAEVTVPEALFDSVADNLVRNALAKRAHGEKVDIAVRLDCGASVELRVSDTGMPVSDDIARVILQGPVPSRGGWGIGLYQAARQAREAGFELALVRNEQGDVCFALREQTTR